ncbi:MAG: NUDIX domain-containing protein [Gammaproteobacteria bacterium]
MDANDVELIARETVFQGYFRIDEYRLRHRLHEGGMSDELCREVFERGQVGALLPVDPHLDRIVLIEQFRTGSYSVGWPPWQIEVVAGIIEDGESAEGLVRREALEEAGCVIEMLEPMHTYLASPGACTETVSLFAGKVDASNAGGIHGLPEEAEDIKVTTHSVSEGVAMLNGSRIANATTLIALQWLALNYEWLKRKWTQGTPAPGAAQ